MTALWLTLDVACCIIAAGTVRIAQVWLDDTWRERWH